MIDADEFKKQEVLEKLRTAEFNDEIKDAVEKIPTAYNVDKVVEQLEEYVKYAEQKAAEYDEAGDIIAVDELDIEAEAYRNAIKIVKSGEIVDE